MSLRSPFQPKAPPCDASRPAVLCNVLILDLPECFLVVLVCDSAPVQTFFLFNQTTRVVLCLDFQTLRSPPTFMTFSIAGYAKLILLYQVIYLLKAFSGSSLGTEKTHTQHSIPGPPEAVYLLSFSLLHCTS